MGSFGLKTFALGMNEEISNLGKMAMGTDFSAPYQSPSMGNAQQPPPQQQMPPQQQPPMPPQQALPPPPQTARAPSVQDKWYQGMIDRGIDPIFARGMMPNIGDESGWNTGIQEHSPRAGKGGRGAYQLTGDRRREFEARYGDDYSDENQLDFLAWEVLQGPESGNYQKILEEAEGDPRRAAAGIVKNFLRPAKEHADRRAAAYLGGSEGNDMLTGGDGGDQFGSGGGSELGVDTADLEALAGETGEQGMGKRQSALFGFFQGLGQLSRGEAPDLSNVMDAYAERQVEARERMMEIMMERRRQQEFGQNRDWQEEDRDLALDERRRSEERAAADREAELLRARDWAVSDQDRAEAEQRALEGRAESRDIRAEDRVQSRTVAERERLSAAGKSAIQLMYKDSPFVGTASSIADVSPETAIAWADREQTKQDALDEENRLKESRQPLADMMTAQGFDDLALQVFEDPNAALKNLQDRIGPTGNMKEALMLMDPSDPAAKALAYRLKLESGVGDPRLENYAKSKDETLMEAEKRVSDTQPLVRQLDYMTELALVDDEQTYLDKLLLTPRAVLDSFGLADKENLTRDQIFEAISNRATSALLAAEAKGSSSDRDVQFFRDVIPHLGNTREANIAAAYALKELARRDKVETEARRAFYNTNDNWSNPTAEQTYVDEALQAAGAKGNVLPQAYSAEEALKLPPGTPFLMIADDGSQTIGIRE